MGHHTLKSSYQMLTERLNRFPQGVPPSEALFKILKVLVNDREAHVLSQLPIKPFTVETASKALRLSPRETAPILEELASRAVLVDMEAPDGTMTYVLPPPMAGFFEFSLMRIRTDIDQKLLSELFHQYLNVEEDFVRELFTAGETRYGRIFVNESVLPANDLTILDYERASTIIKKSPKIGIGVCYCRHKMMHAGTACDAPMDICMTFNGAADSLIRHGHAREVTVSECMSLLEKAYQHNLVQIGENQQEDLPFICNCCGCCCEALLAIKRFGTLQSINTTNYLPEVSSDTCNGCGLCAKACPIAAIELVEKNEAALHEGAQGKPSKVASVLEEACLGCGVCVKACKRSALKLKSREKRVITPVNSVHRIVIMAIERGKLQNLIFDNQAHFSHRALAAVLGAILKLPPLKRLMASQQMKSKYLVSLIRSFEKNQ